LGVPLPLNDLAISLYEAMRAEGVGGKDIAEAFNLFARQGNTDIYGTL
jgi:hypothetical protein